MKRFIMPVLLASGLLFTVCGFGQQAVKLDQQFNLQLTDELIQQQYVEYDFSALQFTNEAAAAKFFKSIENNLVSFSIDYTSKIATMKLYPERLGKHTWTLDQWNSYMSGTTQRCTTTYQSFLHQ